MISISMSLIKISMRKLKKFFSVEAEMKRLHLFILVEAEKGSERKHAFGVIPNLQRRYIETDSQRVKDALSKFMSTKPCGNCDGTRLNESARNIFLKKERISDLTQMNIEELLGYFKSLKLRGTKQEIAKGVIKEIIDRLEFLSNVGLNYLNLERSAETLSGGESQRIRLASQIGSGLVGVMYILDEPTIGLHQRDNQRLINTLTKLRDLGNTVIVVEHDEEVIRSSNHVLDLGPGQGKDGGFIVSEGSVEDILKENKSLTAQYLNGSKEIKIPEKRSSYNKKECLKVLNAERNNLQSIDVEIPLNILTCITGVSGSGKSTLINGTLKPLLRTQLENKPNDLTGNEVLKGAEKLKKIVNISQSPIGGHHDQIQQHIQVYLPLLRNCSQAHRRLVQEAINLEGSASMSKVADVKHVKVVD